MWSDSAHSANLVRTSMSNVNKAQQQQINVSLLLSFQPIQQSIQNVFKQKPSACFQLYVSMLLLNP